MKYTLNRKDIKIWAKDLTLALFRIYVIVAIVTGVMVIGTLVVGLLIPGEESAKLVWIFIAIVAALAFVVVLSTIIRVYVSFKKNFNRGFNEMGADEIHYTFIATSQTLIIRCLDNDADSEIEKGDIDGFVVKKEFMYIVTNKKLYFVLPAKEEFLKRLK
ncbi:MAG: hypothetical protein K5694_02705 [Bacilli bacterium]|nr:hypothetical protein [Bacilli bacterium]